MTNQEALRMAYSKRKDSAGEERDFLNTIIQALEQTRWISISEKLPEEYKRVLFCEKNGYILVGWHRKINERICFIEQVNHYRVNNVIAWMPLPEPYKGESEDKE